MFTEKKGKKIMDGYRIEGRSLGQYLDSVDDNDIRLDQDVQRQFCSNSEMMNGLLYSILSGKIYVPNLILSEEDIGSGIKETYVVDGFQRTETCRRFRCNEYKITENLREHIVQYREKVVDENGNTRIEIKDFDIKNRYYADLPEDLKKRFNKCQLALCIYQNCTTSETSELVLLYNNHTSMNVSQKSLAYVQKFAADIKEITKNNRFLKDCTGLTETDKKNGIWERIISESVMAINYFSNWKSNIKKCCEYLNDNAKIEDFQQINTYFNRLNPYCDKEKFPKIAELFVSKDFCVWMKLFAYFDSLHISDDKFGKFLNEFVDNLKYTYIGSKNWEELTKTRNTKDKKVIEEKFIHLKTLINEFLHIEEESKEENIIDTEKEEVVVNNVDKENTTNSVLSFIKENVSDDIDERDLECFEDTLDDLTIEVDNNSKLLESSNIKSLLAMVAYSFKKDEDLDKWFPDYFSRNDDYFTDQKENFLYMKENFDEWTENKKGEK